MSIVNQVDIKELLTTSHTIAVVGLSSNSLRPSYEVSAYLQRVGYRIIPVNPVEKEILGEKCYASLRDIPEPVDIVDVFRNPDAVGPIAEDAVAIGAKCLWLQEGVVNQEAADKAAAAGLAVVMDRCILKKHRELL
jgi:predicted CoA-binding protein